MTAATPDTLRTALTDNGHPATLAGFRVAAGLTDKPRTWADAVKLDAAAAWLASLADGAEENAEAAPVDPVAAILAAMPAAGTAAPPAPRLSYLHGMTHPEQRAALTAAGLSGDCYLTRDKSGAPVAAARAVVGAVLDGAVLAVPVTRGDAPDGTVPVALSGGWPGYVPSAVCRVVVPVAVVRAGVSLGYDVRPHEIVKDSRGKGRRKPVKAQTYAVRQPATDKAPARAVYVSGYPLEDVVNAANAARVKRDLRARAWSGVDVAAIIAADGLTAAVAAVNTLLGAAAAVEAAATDEATGAAVEAVRGEARADAVTADTDATATRTRRAARSYAGKVARVQSAAVVVNRGRASSAK